MGLTLIFIHQTNAAPDHGGSDAAIADLRARTKTARCSGVLRARRAMTALKNAEVNEQAAE
jgi:hypothetical protein